MNIHCTNIKIKQRCRLSRCAIQREANRQRCQLWPKDQLGTSTWSSLVLQKVCECSNISCKVSLSSIGGRQTIIKEGTASFMKAASEVYHSLNPQERADLHLEEEPETLCRVGDIKRKAIKYFLKIQSLVSWCWSVMQVTEIVFIAYSVSV